MCNNRKTGVRKVLVTPGRVLTGRRATFIKARVILLPNIRVLGQQGCQSRDFVSQSERQVSYTDIKKLALYLQKYYGTQTKGEAFRQNQIAEKLQRVLHQKALLDDFLEQSGMQDIAEFVKIEFPS